MASAREYFRMRQNALKEVEYGEEIRRHRRRRVIAIAVGILLVVGIGVGTYVYETNRTFDEYEVTYDRKREDDDVTVYQEYCGKMLKYNMDGISCLDANNELVWNKTYEMKSPMVEVCDGYVAVCDDGGNRVYVLGSEGPVGEIETKLPIKKLCISGIGTVAVLMEEDDVNYIDYYDKKGTLISENKAPVEKTGFPLDVSLSTDGYKLAVSYMLIENATIQTKLAFYNFDSVGENEIDHLVAAANYENTIIPEVTFLTKDLALVAGTDFWDVYVGTQKPKKTFRKELTKEIKSLFYDEGHVGFVFDGSGGDAPYRMEVYDVKGRLLFEKDFGFEYENIIIRNSMIYMYGGGGCRIYTMKGKLIYEGGYEDELESVIPLDKRNLILVFPERLLRIRLK